MKLHPPQKCIEITSSHLALDTCKHQNISWIAMSTAGANSSGTTLSRMSTIQNNFCSAMKEGQWCRAKLITRRLS